jgi:hypothetical protein
MVAGAYTLSDAIRSPREQPPTIAGAGIARLLLLGAGLSIAT